MPVALVVDDDPDIAGVAAYMLERAGFEVHCESDGEAGVTTAVAVRPDVVLLDSMRVAYCAAMPNWNRWRSFSLPPKLRNPMSSQGSKRAPTITSSNPSVQKISSRVFWPSLSETRKHFDERHDPSTSTRNEFLYENAHRSQPATHHKAT
jgi:DNA-binding NarL/FixJ family response regulator